MTCERVQELLSELIDQELDPQTSQEITEHLHQCPACDQVYRELRLIVQQSAALEPVSPPDRLYWTIRRRVRNVQRRPWFAPKRVGWILVPALATVALMLVLFPREKTTATSSLPPTPEALLPDATAPEEISVPPMPAPALRVRRRSAVEIPGASVSLTHTSQPLVRGSVQGTSVTIVHRPSTEIVNSLRNIEQALDEIEAALRQNPGNPQVIAAYRATYQKGIELKDRYLIGAR
jgi:anti-sigma factor RsiW